MMTATLLSKPGQPTWEVAALFPPQGHWTVDDYLALKTNHLVELADGCLEVLPMPTTSHQVIVAFLYAALKGFVDERNLGMVLFAPLRVRLWEGQFREPDLLFMARQHASRIHEEFWDGADLVMEVVSPAKPEHDRKTKRREYARAGIPEYWIIDTLNGTIQVLTLANGRYRVHGTFGAGQSATSRLLKGFAVGVDEVLG